MRWKIVLAAALVLSSVTGAQAGFIGLWGGHSNDTGGIIPWSPEIAYSYREIAAADCARWNKIAVITSVHPRYGDYVGFVCHFPRGYDPKKGFYAAPVVVRTLN